MSNKIVKAFGLISLLLLVLSVALDQVGLITKPLASLILNIGLLFFVVAGFVAANCRLKSMGTRKNQ